MPQNSTLKEKKRKQFIRNIISTVNIILSSYIKIVMKLINDKIDIKKVKIYTLIFLRIQYGNLQYQLALICFRFIKLFGSAIVFVIQAV